MTASRNTVVVALAAIAALALLALFLGVGRESQMRDAEADFQARLRGGEIGGGVKPQPAPPATTPVETARNDAELADWYAGEGADTASNQAPPAP